MEEPIDNIYKLSKEREKKLWHNAIFVFDSSALLDFYFLPLATRNKIFDELFSKQLKSRLWIPNHVRYEYNKNRERVIIKPITENYKPLKDENFKLINTSLKEIENSINDLKNKTKGDDKHPYLLQDEIDNYIEIIEAFKSESNSFEDKIFKRIGKAVEEINKLPENDDVLNAINKLFKVGRYYAFQEIIEITKEGKHRFDYSIPPGYSDLNDKEKKGTQIFGDLIIWKQIMEYAKETKRPIIFVCNDLKEDWCYLEKKTEKRIASPREELIKEIYDFSKVEFWMYNQPQFLYKSNQYFDAKIEKQNIDNLYDLVTIKTKERKNMTESEKKIHTSNNIYGTWRSIPNVNYLGLDVTVKLNEANELLTINILNGNDTEVSELHSSAHWFEDYLIFIDGMRFFVLYAHAEEMTFGEVAMPGNFDGKVKWKLKFRRI